METAIPLPTVFIDSSGIAVVTRIWKMRIPKGSSLQYGGMSITFMKREAQFAPLPTWNLICLMSVLLSCGP